MEKLFKLVRNPHNPKILAIGKNYVKHVRVDLVLIEHRKWVVINHQRNP